MHQVPRGTIDGSKKPGPGPGFPPQHPHQLTLKVVCLVSDVLPAWTVVVTVYVPFWAVCGSVSGTFEV